MKHWFADSAGRSGSLDTVRRTPGAAYGNVNVQLRCHYARACRNTMVAQAHTAASTHPGESCA